MIRRTITPGTKVFHEVAGFGIFRGWTEDGDPIIEFDDETAAMSRKDLTEVEE